MENRNPETVEELYSLGLTFLEGQDWQNAIKCFKGVLVIHPEHEGATTGRQKAEKQLDLADSYGKGQRAFDDGMWEEAIEHFEKVVSLDTNYKDATAKLEEAKKQRELPTLYELGSQHYIKEEWSEAIAQFEKVVSLDPRYRDAAAMLRAARRKERLAADYVLGLGSYNKGDWEGTIERFKRVVDLEPGYRDAAIKLEDAKKQLKLAGLYKDGMRYFEDEKWGKAVKGFRKIIGLSQNYKDTAAKLKEAEERLKVERGKGPDWSRLATIGSAVVGIVVFVAALVQICSWIWPEFPLKYYFVAPTSTPTPTLTSTSSPALASISTATDTPTTTPTLTTIIPPSTSTLTTTSTPTPTLTATPIRTPDAVVNAENLNLRSGPGVVYDVLQVLKRGDHLKVTGRSLTGDWLKVIAPNGQEGWTACSLLQVNVNVGGVAVVQVPPTPTSMYTPTPPVTPPPELFSAPILLEPKDREGDFAGSVTLKWQWERPLGPDEYFSLRVRNEQAGDCHHSQVKEPAYIGGLSYCPSGEYYWQVAVVKLCEECPNEQKWETLSHPSKEEWSFRYQTVEPDEPWEPPEPPENPTPVD